MIDMIPTTPAANAMLSEALAVAEPLVTWLVRCGIGHAAFAAALKPVFLAQAEAELQRTGRKSTDTAASLLSGLHRKDVRAFRAAADDSRAAAARAQRWGKPSAASQVVARWLSLGWPDSLPFSGPEPSFETLARRVSRDFHERALLSELVRLGVVREADGTVSLERAAFVPNQRLEETRRLMAGAVADHLAAGVHNLSGDPSHKFLEQSVFADGLSEASVRQLHLLANTLWAQAMQQVVDAAVPLCEADAGLQDQHRFRLGMFSYSAPDPGGNSSELHS